MVVGGVPEGVGVQVARFRNLVLFRLNFEVAIQLVREFKVAAELLSQEFVLVGGVQHVHGGAAVAVEVAAPEGFLLLLPVDVERDQHVQPLRVNGP